jgi:hypothetical protein
MAPVIGWSKAADALAQAEWASQPGTGASCTSIQMQGISANGIIGFHSAPSRLNSFVGEVRTINAMANAAIAKRNPAERMPPMIVSTGAAAISKIRIAKTAVTGHHHCRSPRQHARKCFGFTRRNRAFIAARAVADSS